MKVKALISFSGSISMYASEIREIEEGEVLTDLLNACYVEEVKAKTKTETTEKVVTKNESKRTKK